MEGKRHLHEIGESYRREPALRPPTHELVPYLTHQVTGPRGTRARLPPRPRSRARILLQLLSWPRLVGHPHALARSPAPQADPSILQLCVRPGAAAVTGPEAAVPGTC